MNPRGLSAADLRKRNRAGILRLVHSQGAMARNDLAGALGLSRASVTILSGEMLDEGLLVEAGSSAAAGKAGRRKIFLRIRPEAGALVGVGVESDRTQVLVTDLAGEVRAMRELPSPGKGPGAGKDADPGVLLARAVLGAVSGILGDSAPRNAGVVGAGLGVTGRVDPESGTSLREPRIWEGPVALARPLSEALDVPSAVDNNVRALALAELLLTEARRDPPPGLLFVKYGPGVGGAWTTGGRPWAGAQNRAGEIGHTLVEPDGPVCPMCGRRGCLESLVSLGTLRGRGAPGREGHGASRIEAILESMDREDPQAYALLAGRFARALGNAIELLDPSLVALYGTPFRSEGLLGHIASRVESTGRACEIRRSGLDPDLPALGGAALALDAFFEAGGIPAGSR